MGYVIQFLEFGSTVVSCRVDYCHRKEERKERRKDFFLFFETSALS
jgi:hypothetical protein